MNWSLCHVIRRNSHVNHLNPSSSLHSQLRQVLANAFNEKLGQLPSDSVLKENISWMLLGPDFSFNCNTVPRQVVGKYIQDFTQLEKEFQEIEDIKNNNSKSDTPSQLHVLNVIELIVIMFRTLTMKNNGRPGNYELLIAPIKRMLDKVISTDNNKNNRNSYTQQFIDEAIKDAISAERSTKQERQKLAHYYAVGTPLKTRNDNERSFQRVINKYAFPRIGTVYSILANESCYSFRHHNSKHVQKFIENNSVPIKNNAEDSSSGQSKECRTMKPLPKKAKSTRIRYSDLRLVREGAASKRKLDEKLKDLRNLAENNNNNNSSASSCCTFIYGKTGEKIGFVKFKPSREKTSGRWFLRSPMCNFHNENNNSGERIEPELENNEEDIDENKYDFEDEDDEDDEGDEETSKKETKEEKRKNKNRFYFGMKDVQIVGVYSCFLINCINVGWRLLRHHEIEFQQNAHRCNCKECVFPGHGLISRLEVNSAHNFCFGGKDCTHFDGRSNKEAQICLAQGENAVETGDGIFIPEMFEILESTNEEALAEKLCRWLVCKKSGDRHHFSIATKCWVELQRLEVEKNLPPSNQKKSSKKKPVTVAVDAETQALENEIDEDDKDASNGFAEFFNQHKGSLIKKFDFIKKCKQQQMKVNDDDDGSSDFWSGPEDFYLFYPYCATVAHNIIEQQKLYREKLVANFERVPNNQKINKKEREERRDRYNAVLAEMSDNNIDAKSLGLHLHTKEMNNILDVMLRQMPRKEGVCSLHHDDEERLPRVDDEKENERLEFVLEKLNKNKNNNIPVTTKDLYSCVFVSNSGQENVLKRHPENNHLPESFNTVLSDQKPHFDNNEDSHVEFNTRPQFRSNLNYYIVLLSCAIGGSPTKVFGSSLKGSHRCSSGACANIFHVVFEMAAADRARRYCSALHCKKLGRHSPPCFGFPGNLSPMNYATSISLEELKEKSSTPRDAETLLLDPLKLHSPTRSKVIHCNICNDGKPLADLRGALDEKDGRVTRSEQVAKWHLWNKHILPKLQIRNEAGKLTNISKKLLVRMATTKPTSSIAEDATIPLSLSYGK